MNKLWIGALTVMLTGCAAVPEGTQSFFKGQGCGNQLTQEQELMLGLAEDVARDGKRHAALAHFESLPTHVPQVRLNKAKVLRQLNQPGAHELYQSVLNTCLAAYGHHGLGQLAFAQHEYLRATEQLSQAVRLVPTDASIRNDYALALLAQGQRDRARFEWATALELEPTHKRAAINMVSLLLLENQWDQAAALSAKTGLTAHEMRTAQQQAEHYRLPVAPSEIPLAKPSSITDADIAQILQATKEKP